MKNNPKLLWVLTLINLVLVSIMAIALLYLAIIQYPTMEKTLRTEYQSADEWISCDFESCASYEKKLEEFVTKENQKLYDHVNENTKALQKGYDEIYDYLFLKKSL